MSEDSFTEVTSESWGSRLGGALQGIIIGILLIVAAFFLLFWNEGRAVKRYKTLKEGGGLVSSIAADTVTPANDGKLVHLTGMATTSEILSDQSFGVQSNAIKLQRNVEMYQWQQESQSETKKKLGGGTETVTTYTYNKAWSDNLIDSSSFKKQSGHENPALMPYSSEEKIAGQVTMGAFTLSPSLVGKMNAYTAVALSTDYTLPPEFEQPSHIVADTIYLGQNPSSPELGDIRVSFKEVKPMNISLVAKQVNNSFEPYQAEAGGSIELLETGVHTADAMFQQAQQSNTIMTWVLRVLGFILMFIGFRLLLAPLAVLADILPILGDIVEVGTGLIAALVAGVLSFLTIAIAWFVYRPVFSIILIVIAGGIGAATFVTLRKGKTKTNAAETSATAPPPPPPPGASA